MGNVNWIREETKKVERAAARGNAGAVFNMAACYAEGIGVEASQEKSDKCLNIAARAGYGRARVAAARRLLEEERTSREQRVALSWLAQAARLGDKEALDFLIAYLRRAKQAAAGLPAPPLPQLARPWRIVPAA